MHSGTVSTFAVLLASSLVSADFKVFCGRDQNGLDGIAASECMFFNNPPDCSNVDNSVPFYIRPDNDASFSGVACDGCSADTAIADWDLTRLEINEPDYFDNGADHFTIYKGDGNYVMRDTDNNEVGTCNVPADPQNTDCSTPISNSALKNVFDCVTVITFNNSPN